VGHHCSATGLCAAFPLHCEPERAWLEQHWGRWGLLWQCGVCAGGGAGAEEGGACSQPLDIVQRYYGSAIALYQLRDTMIVVSTPPGLTENCLCFSMPIRIILMSRSRYFAFLQLFTRSLLAPALVGASLAAVRTGCCGAPPILPCARLADLTGISLRDACQIRS
jgi:hypothetical protein